MCETLELFPGRTSQLCVRACVPPLLSDFRLTPDKVSSFEDLQVLPEYLLEASGFAKLSTTQCGAWTLGDGVRTESFDELFLVGREAYVGPRLGSWSFVEFRRSLTDCSLDVRGAGMPPSSKIQRVLERQLS